MHRLYNEEETDTSWGTRNSDSDSEMHFSTSRCQGCYVLKGTGEQCSIQGYGGAPLQSWLLSSIGRKCQVFSISVILLAVMVLAFTMTSPEKPYFFWTLLVIFILCLITMLLFIWYIQGTIHKFRYPHTCARVKEPICL
ncbi:hypothetical protein ACHWQZ_G009777 [Mnemiopsis leidyi]